MIELTEVIHELRRELKEALVVDTKETLLFELGPIELEVSVALAKQGGANARVKFWVVEAGGDAQVTQTSTQRIKLSLHPRLAGSSTPPWVAGEETDRER